MTWVSVIEVEGLDYAALSQFELDSALGYARTCYEQNLDRDLLRVLVNTTHKRRKPGVILPMLAANVVKETVLLKQGASPGEVEEHEALIEAYKAAVMKTMSIRSVWKRRQDAQKRKQGIPVPPKPKATEHPEDPNAEHQLRLFS